MPRPSPNRAEHDPSKPAPAGGAALKDEPAAAPRRRETTRDFVEQIVIAFILAFLVRGFEAEAFVIPTGSMAPTLMGAHKEVACPHCGYTSTIGETADLDPAAGGGGYVALALCQNCRAPMRTVEDPSFNGDRILVMKFLYNLDLPWLREAGPERWDVVVFHYPEEPETNYIKRLVGLPGEELRVWFGDVFARPSGSDEPFRILRKPLRHQEAMQMTVWDDRHRPRALAGRPEWARWAPREVGAWSEPEPGRFVSAPGDDWAELRYRHLVPEPAQWRAIFEGREPPGEPRPSLISDFYAYNTGSANPGFLPPPIAPHWVGDLTLGFRVVTGSDTGRVRIELVKGGVPYRCEIDVATGRATLWRGDEPLGPPAETPIRGRGVHRVQLANVDGRLTLRVDGQTPFGEGFAYDDGESDPEGRPIPTAADLDPAGVAALGAEVSVSELVLSRDIYYTVSPGRWDYHNLGLSTDRALYDPSEFAALAGVRSVEFRLQPRSFLMLGDNSPRSKDSRGWTRADRTGYYDERRKVHVGPWADLDGPERLYFEVPEEYLIGKAFFVYWPHGRPFWPSIRLTENFRVPFRPYFERMQWIR